MVYNILIVCSIAELETTDVSLMKYIENNSLWYNVYTRACHS